MLDQIKTWATTVSTAHSEAADWKLCPSYLPRTLLLWASLISTLVLAALSSMDPPPAPFKYTNGEIADLCPTGITPSASTFSIWGLIYMMQLVYAVWQSWPSQRHHPQLGRLAVLTSIAYCCSSLWLIAFGNKLYFTAELLIVAYALCLAYAYYYLGVGLVRVSPLEHFCCFLPLSLHLSWVLLATLLGFNITLVCGFGWTPTVDFSFMCLLLAGLLCAYVQLTRRDVSYALVVLWAASGIRENSEDDTVRAAARALQLAAVASWLLGYVLRGGTASSPKVAEQLLPDVEKERNQALRYRLQDSLDVEDFSHRQEAALPLSET